MLKNVFKKAVKQNADKWVPKIEYFFLASLGILKEEENLPMRAAFIGGGGFLGLLTAAIRRRRFFGKTLYTAVGAGLFASLLYPEDAVQFGHDLKDEGERLSKIAVNFVQGVQPGNDSKKD